MESLLNESQFYSSYSFDKIMKKKQNIHLIATSSIIINDVLILQEELNLSIKIEYLLDSLTLQLQKMAWPV